MNAKRSAIILINIAVFAGAGLVFYWLLHGGRLTVIPDDADTNHHTDAIVTVQVGSIARSTVHRIVTAHSSRKRLTWAETKSIVRSISSSVVCRCRLKRTLLCARAGARPIASSTCEGSLAPEEHAAPLDTAKPLRSSAITSASPSR